MRNTLRAVTLSSLLAGSALAFPIAAQAQSAPTPAAPTEQPAADDIIVTAQKRNERLIDVPFAITAVSADTIAERGVTNISDIQQLVPSLRIVQLGVGSQRVELRGISQYQGLPTVGSYLDEVSVNAGAAQGTQLDVRLIDLERVEVLRGPQPTLYGEGSVGGTIRYVTASPDLEKFGAHLESSLGFIQDGGITWRAQGVLNLPIIPEKLGVRFAVDHEDSGGFIDVPAIGVKDGNGVRATTYRGKILAKPTDRLTLSLMVQHQQEDEANQNFSGLNRSSIAAIPTPLRDRNTVGNFIASYDFGPVTLLSTTGIIDRHFRTTYDVTAFYAPFFGLFGLSPSSTAPEASASATYSETEEVRFSTNGSGPIRALIGGIYTNARTYSGFGIRINPVDFAPLDYQSDGSSKSKSWAIFGSVDYDITRRLSVGVGGRYFEDKQHTFSNTANFFGGAATIVDSTGTFRTFNPRVDIKYKTSDTGTVYFNAAKGFRSGGFNQPSPLTPLTYGPEQLYSYELGLKQQFFDRRLTIDTSVYYNDYRNVQAQVPIFDRNGVQVSSATTNQGKANGAGVDVAADLRLTRAWTLGGNLGYSHVRVKTVSSAKISGDPLDLVPDWTWSVYSDYRAPLPGSVTGTAHIDAGHTASGVLTLRNFQPQTFSDAYTLVNARLGLDFKRFEAYLYVNNLADENRRVQPAFGGYAEPLLTRPRTIGAGIKTNF